MTTYYGSWTANSGSTWGTRTDTNRRRLERDLRAIARGNTFAGNVGTWAVALETPNNGLAEIKTGQVRHARV